MTGYNPARGDVKIDTLHGAWLLRPSFAAIVRLEEHFARSIFDIARDYAGGSLVKAQDLVVFVRTGMEAAGADVPEQLEECMQAHGFAKFLAPVGAFLAHACGLET